MIEGLLKALTPEMVVHAVRTNQSLVMDTLHKFDEYKSFGRALNTDQQICISNNLDKVNEFFLSYDGQATIRMLAEEFVKFCSKP